MNRKINCVILFAVWAVLMFFVSAPARAEDGVAVSQDGTTIAFSVYGEGEPALIFVHGWCCNRSVWKNQVPYFEKEYKVVTLDLAGHGASGPERDVYSMEAFGEDVAAVVRQIQASQVVLIGHSMSGIVIIEAAEIIPDKVLALIGIDTMQDFEETYTPEQIEEHLKPFRDDFKTTVDSFVRGMFVEGTDPELMDDVAGMMSGASQKTGVSAMEEMMKMSYITDPPHIKVPVWCLNADLWPTKPEVNRKYVPEFNLRLMPDRGHFIMLEDPDEFNRELDGIIKEIKADALDEEAGGDY